MAAHEVSLTDAKSLSLSLSDGWLTSSWEGMKGVFYRRITAGLFAPNITIAAYQVEDEPTLNEIRDQLVATYNTALGHKLLGVEMINNFLESPGVRLESIVVAPNGLRVVQTVRAGTIRLDNGEIYQVEIAGSCTQKQASDFLPEMRSSLRFVKMSELKEELTALGTTVKRKESEDLNSSAPRRFPSPKKLDALPPLRVK